MEGGCTCREVRYRLVGAPMFVHCCHCTWCQRESGSAFALNALYESARVEVTAGSPVIVDTPSASGQGQRVARCPTCHVALWSNYGPRALGDRIRFVRVGTMDDARTITPDIHIYTSTKQPWVVLPEGARAVPEYYKSADVWPAHSLARRRDALA